MLCVFFSCCIHNVFSRPGIYWEDEKLLIVPKNDTYVACKSFLLARNLQLPCWISKVASPVKKTDCLLLSSANIDFMMDNIRKILQWENVVQTKLDLREYVAGKKIGTLFTIQYCEKDVIQLCDVENNLKLRPRKMTNFVRNYLNWPRIPEQCWQKSYMHTLCMIMTILAIKSQNPKFRDWETKNPAAWFDNTSIDEQEYVSLQSTSISQKTYSALQTPQNPQTLSAQNSSISNLLWDISPFEIFYSCDKQPEDPLHRNENYIVNSLEGSVTLNSMFNHGVNNVVGHEVNQMPPHCTVFHQKIMHAHSAMEPASNMWLPFEDREDNPFFSW